MNANIHPLSVVPLPIKILPKVKNPEKKLQQTKLKIKGLIKEKRTLNQLNLRLEARVQRLELDLDILNESHHCHVCFTAPSSILLMPCMHELLCESCLKILSKQSRILQCPLCRVNVLGQVKVFHP